MTNGKLERYHQRDVNQLPYEMPSDLEAAIVAFVSYYKYRRYHKALGNVMPSDVIKGRRQDRMANQRGSFQARYRMRVVDIMLPSLHQIHVIRAITRHLEIDKEGLYGQALADFTHGDNEEAFSALGEFVHKVTSGTLLDDKSDAPVRTLLSMDLHDVEEHTCSNIREFNRRYLNDKGISAVLTLLAFDAAGLDPVAIDVLRGGEALSAAYGPRKTRRDKKLGKEMQS